MGPFRNHAVKDVIRKQWCTPILKYLSQKLGYKLVYLGLPGIDALDINEWLPYLSKVIAFDCGDYRHQPNPAISKVNLGKLNSTLSDLERKGSIESYSLHPGYIEKVVLRGLDESGRKFSQSDVITVYNLDFCNSLTVPLSVVDSNGNVTKHYKLEAVQKLLEMQNGFSPTSKEKKFVMFMTVNSFFWESEARKLLKQKKVDPTVYASYLSSLSTLRAEDKEVRQLKLYAFHMLKEHFLSSQFIPDFLPPIHYRGVGDRRLVCFTIFGTQPPKRAPVVPSGSTHMETLLRRKFLGADHKGIGVINCKGISESDIKLDPLESFCSTATYQELWSR